MTIEKYIKDLLYRHNAVSVPAFGTFIVAYAPARLDTVSQQFFPPTKEVRFDTTSKDSDTLLQDYIAEATNSNSVEARKGIDVAVAHWMEQLLQGSLTLSGIGDFSVEDAMVVFKAIPSSNYLTSSFGLDAVVAESISREILATKAVVSPVIPVVKTENEKVPVAKTVQKPIAKTVSSYPFVAGEKLFYPKTKKDTRKELVESVDTTEKIVPIIPKVTEEKQYKPSYFKYVAAAAVLLLMTTVGYKYSQNKEVRIAQEEALQKEVQIQKATFAIPELLPSVSLVTEKDTSTSTASIVRKFHIIAGAFREPVNANKKLNQLLKMGYDAKLVGKNKWGLTEVAYGSFSDKDDAVNKLRYIKKNHSPKAWLLVKSVAQ